jgi:hypothetical protein
MVGPSLETVLVQEIGLQSNIDNRKTLKYKKLPFSQTSKLQTIEKRSRTRNCPSVKHQSYRQSKNAHVQEIALQSNIKATDNRKNAHVQETALQSNSLQTISTKNCQRARNFPSVRHTSNNRPSKTVYVQETVL